MGEGRVRVKVKETIPPPLYPLPPGEGRFHLGVFHLKGARYAEDQ